MAERQYYGTGRDIASGALKGGATGAKVGSLMGPTGSLVGGLVGGLAGGVSGFFDQKSERDRLKELEMQALGFSGEEMAAALRKHRDPVARESARTEAQMQQAMSPMAVSPSTAIANRMALQQATQEGLIQASANIAEEEQAKKTRQEFEIQDAREQLAAQSRARTAEAGKALLDALPAIEQSIIRQAQIDAMSTFQSELGRRGDADLVGEAIAAELGESYTPMVDTSLTRQENRDIRRAARDTFSFRERIFPFLDTEEGSLARDARQLGRQGDRTLRQLDRMERLSNFSDNMRKQRDERAMVQPGQTLVQTVADDTVRKMVTGGSPSSFDLQHAAMGLKDLMTQMDPTKVFGLDYDIAYRDAPDGSYVEAYAVPLDIEG